MRLSATPLLRLAYHNFFFKLSEPDYDISPQNFESSPQSASCISYHHHILVDVEVIQGLATSNVQWQFQLQCPKSEPIELEQWEINLLLPTEIST